MKKKILLEILKIACEEVYVQQKIFKDSTFSQLLLKDFAETFQNAYWEIVMIFLDRNTPNNKDLNATNKKIKKVSWHRCWSKIVLLKLFK